MRWAAPRNYWLMGVLGLLSFEGTAFGAPPAPADQCQALTRGEGTTPKVTLIPVNFASPEELAERASELVSMNVHGEPTGRVVADQRSSELVVYDTPEVACRIRALVQQLDVASPQVKLQMRAYSVPAELKESDKIEWVDTPAAVVLDGKTHAQVRVGRWKAAQENPMALDRASGIRLCGQYHGVMRDRTPTTMWGCLEKPFYVTGRSDQLEAVAGVTLQLIPATQSESSTLLTIEDLQWYGQTLFSVAPAAVLLNKGETLVLSVSLTPQSKKSKDKPVECLIVVSTEVFAPQAMND